MADIGDVSQKAFFLDGGNGHAAHRNASGMSFVSSHQDRSQCGFTAAAFSHQRRKAAPVSYTHLDVYKRQIFDRFQSLRKPGVTDKTLFSFSYDCPDGFGDNTVLQKNPG